MQWQWRSKLFKGHKCEKIGGNYGAEAQLQPVDLASEAKRRSAISGFDKRETNLFFFLTPFLKAKNEKRKKK